MADDDIPAPEPAPEQTAEPSPLPSDDGSEAGSEAGHGQQVSDDGAAREGAENASPASPEPPPAPRRRGRPRKDGLPPGSDEAKAADAERGASRETALPKASEGAPPGASSPETERADPTEPRADSPDAPRPSPAKPPRRQARAVAATVKPQNPDKPHCEDPHCTASHPSRGGKAGRVCVETGAKIVAPMQMPEGERIVSGVFKAIGFLIALFGGVPRVSDPTELEIAMATPPTIRMLHRMGIGEGNMWLDGFMLALALGMYSSGRVAEVRDAQARKRLAA